MSLKETDVRYVPAETKRVAKAAFPNGSLALFLRDELEGLYSDELFADLYGKRGKPAEAPWRLALVTILQFAGDLSDRQAAEAVQSKIDWKYALGLELTDTGFDFTVLSKFRKRLQTSNAAHRLFDELLKVCQAKSLIRKRGQARTDSTHVLAKVRALNRLGNYVETIRLALNTIATKDPKWLKEWMPEVWYERYGERFESFHAPKQKKEVQALITTIAEDGFVLLRKLYEADTAYGLAELPEVEILRKVWLQQYWLDNGKVRQRDTKDLPPASQLIISTYDIDARFGTKRETRWIGYKLHVTETCDEDLAHLITHVETSESSRHDSQQIPSIHKTLEEKELLPEVHLVDAGYINTKLLLNSKTEYGIDLHGPLPEEKRWQDDAYALSDFTISWEAETALCPQGKQSISWRETLTSRGNPSIRVCFSSKDCTPCHNRSLCTRSKNKKQARILSFSPKEQFDTLMEARQTQKTEDWQSTYKTRSGIEGTISQGVRAFGMRRSRYFGYTKTHFQHEVIATALNVVRLKHWFAQKPRAQTRVSRLARLAA